MRNNHESNWKCFWNLETQNCSDEQSNAIVKNKDQCPGIQSWTDNALQQRFNLGQPSTVKIELKNTKELEKISMENENIVYTCLFSNTGENFANETAEFAKNDITFNVLNCGEHEFVRENLPTLENNWETNVTIRFG